MFRRVASGTKAGGGGGCRQAQSGGRCGTHCSPESASAIPCSIVFCAIEWTCPSRPAVTMHNDRSARVTARVEIGKGCPHRARTTAMAIFSPEKATANTFENCKPAQNSAVSTTNRLSRTVQQLDTSRPSTKFWYWFTLGRPNCDLDVDMTARCNAGLAPTVVTDQQLFPIRPSGPLGQGPKAQ